MYIPLPEALKLTPEHQQFLQTLEIDKDSPGLILHDFETLLSIAKDSELQLTGKHQLPMGALTDINSRLTHPIAYSRPIPSNACFRFDTG